MGCDIHIYPEFKPQGRPNIWMDMSGTVIDDAIEDAGERNYNIFTMLANVRSSNLGIPVLNNGYLKGAPSDMSESTLKEYGGWGVDGHSHTWFNLQELADWPLWNFWKDDDWNPAENWVNLIEVMSKMAVNDYQDGEFNADTRSIKEIAQSFRVVIWFDN